jgi:hypothetical protein
MSERVLVTGGRDYADAERMASTPRPVTFASEAVAMPTEEVPPRISSA